MTANLNGHTKHIVATLDRKGEIAQAAPPRHTALRQAAENISLKNVDRAIVELMSEAMQRLTELAYEADGDGYLNIDPVTHRLLIPAPWGRSGHKKWGLSQTESVVLREVVQRRQIGRDHRPPGLFLYDRARRNWRVNIFDFDTLADGQRYWQRWPLTVQEYREARSRRQGGTVV